MSVIIPFPPPPPLRREAEAAAAAKRAAAAVRLDAKLRARWLLVWRAAALNACQREFLLRLYVAKRPPTPHDLHGLAHCDARARADTTRRGLDLNGGLPLHALPHGGGGTQP